RPGECADMARKTRAGRLPRPRATAEIGRCRQVGGRRAGIEWNGREGMIDRDALLKNSLIVAAHADDEILWFNSIAADVDRILVVYCDFWAHPDLGRQRQAAFADYPRQIECLAIDE